MATVLTQKQKDLRSISFGSEQGVRPHSLYREVADVRNDVEAAFKRIEQGDIPTVIASSIKVYDLGNNGVASGVVFVSDFSVRSHIASVTIDDKIVIKHPGGTSANSLTVEVLAGVATTATVGEDGNLTITVVDDIDISALVSLINSDNEIAFFAELAAGANGAADADTIAVTSATKLSGGAGLGVSASVSSVTVAGAIQSVDLKLSAVDTSSAMGAKLSFNSADFANAPVAGQVASLKVVCHTSKSTIPLVVIAD
jgi:hypothetical protein